MTGLRASAVRDVFDTGLGGSGGSGGSVPIGADGTGTPVVDVRAERWSEAAELARGALGLDFLDWLSAVDEPDADPPGIDVVVHLADSRAITRRLLLRTRTDAAAPRLPSLTRLWPGVAWHERETYEMFGVVFDGFDDGQRAPGSGGPSPETSDAGLLGLRPLLLPDGFEGTPLRKSFVLAARVSKPWPGAKEPGEGAAGAPSRRKTRPPGVPDPSWGPHDPGAPDAGPEPAAPSEPAAPAARPPRRRGATS